MPRFLSSLLLVLSASPAFAGAFVFGDSSVEQGNLYARPGYERPGTPYYHRDGFSRESNGPVWIEHLAPGIMPDAGARRGSRLVNFAYSGATSGDDNIAGPVKNTGFNAQIDAFKTRGLRGEKGDFFAVAIGTNDFIRDLLGQRDLRKTSKEVIGNVSHGLSRLSALGAQRLLVEDIPNLQKAPAFAHLVPPEDEDRFDTVMTKLLDQHRAAQLAALRTQNAQLKTTDIVTVKVSKLFDYVLDHARELGFKTVTKACYDEDRTTLCSKDRAVQNSYLFFDGLHLTEAGQRIQADYYRALTDQLDGSAHALPQALAGFALDRENQLAASARDQRFSSWSGPIAPEGFGVSAAAGSGSDDTRFGSLGIDWSNGTDWTARLDVTRDTGQVGGFSGESDIVAWSAVVSGERRFGDMRIGASVGTLTGDAEGTRRMPVAHMSADHNTDLTGHFAELSAGTVVAQGGLTLLPAAWLRWSDLEVGGFSERGETGLEMAFDDITTSGLTGGVGLDLRVQASDRITPWASISYEDRLAGFDGTLTGRLIENSADDIRRKLHLGEGLGQLRAGVDIGIADGGLLQLSGFLTSEESAGVKTRLSWRF